MEVILTELEAGLANGICRNRRSFAIWMDD